MGNMLQRVLQWLRTGGPFGTVGGNTSSDPSSPRDPYAGKPVPVRSGPKGRSGAVAVAEPDE
jgi:hypothetical protein